jgi:hypothetical protein
MTTLILCVPDAFIVAERTGRIQGDPTVIARAIGAGFSGWPQNSPAVDFGHVSKPPRA